MEKNLKEYATKRDFTKTSEPKPRKSKTKENIFVIQKHDARRLHYDFRLAINGVLVSWAIPKGPSLNPTHKRLAIMTEDHPLEYQNFEGIIPEGNYGAGPVIIWDSGTYKNIKRDENGKLIKIEKCLKMGIIEIELYGKKLNGKFALINTKTRGNEKNWMLIKMKDVYTNKSDITKEDRSVVSNKSIEDIEKENKE